MVNTCALQNSSLWRSSQSMLILENPTGHVAGILETDTWTTEVERGPRGQRVERLPRETPGR